MTKSEHVEKGGGIESGAASLIHTFIALAVLLVFWAAIGAIFWPQLMPALFRTVQTARSVGAERVESRLFAVRNASDASDAQVSFVVQSLERDLTAIRSFLGNASADVIPLLITNGDSPALADGVQLNAFYDNGVINLDTAPLFLTLLADGEGVDATRNLFGQVGYAVYVSEEIGRAQSLVGQSADAWTELLRQNEAILPLTDALDVGLPQGERDAMNFLRAMMEAGSFARWVAKEHGLDAARALRQGASIEEATGLDVDQAQEQWLAAVAEQEIKPKSCVLALPSFMPRSLCDRIIQR